MRKSFYFVLSAAVLLLTIPSCQKSQKWSKHTVTEEFVYVTPEKPDHPCDKCKDEKKAEKVPTICRWTAKRLVKAAMTEREVINNPALVPVQIGYYECDNEISRQNLYKLQVNKLLNVTYSEIKNKFELPTYWVDVQLTGKGKSLIVKDDTPVFPEDTICPKHMKALINPESGLNQYGEFTMDPNVPEDVVSLIKNFYAAYIQDKPGAINQFGTPDLQKAEQRINIANDLNIRRLVVDPFVREGVPAAEALEGLTIHKWTSYVDLFIVRIQDAEYCIVVKEDNGQKKIDDIALNSPERLGVKRTLRCTAADITAKELHKALKEKEAKAKQAAAKNKKEVAPKEVKQSEPEKLEFEEYNPQLAPGIEIAEHAAPTLYEIAKAAEHVETVNLFAGVAKFKEMGKLKLVKDAQVPTYTAVVTIETVKVNALGRIFRGLTEGEQRKVVATFTYDKDEEVWNVAF